MDSDKDDVAGGESGSGSGQPGADGESGSGSEQPGAGTENEKQNCYVFAEMIPVSYSNPVCFLLSFTCRRYSGIIAVAGTYH